MDCKHAAGNVNGWGKRRASVQKERERSVADKVRDQVHDGLVHINGNYRVISDEHERPEPWNPFVVLSILQSDNSVHSKTQRHEMWVACLLHHLLATLMLTWAVPEYLESWIQQLVLSKFQIQYKEQGRMADMLHRYRLTPCWSSEDSSHSEQGPGHASCCTVTPPHTHTWSHV